MSEKESGTVAGAVGEKKSGTVADAVGEQESRTVKNLAMNGFCAPKRERVKRKGRGTGSGKGKTCGRGHKGQRSRAGARRDGVFEGGQMPLTRRVPKRGFRSRLARVTAQLRLSDLQKLAAENAGEEITVAFLQKKGLLKNGIKRARVFQSGELGGVAVTVSGIPVSAGARAAIEKAGGSVAAEKPRAKPSKLAAKNKGDKGNKGKPPARGEEKKNSGGT